MMQTHGVAHDPAHVAFEVGAIEWPSSGDLGFTFSWTYDDPTMEDEEESVTLGLRISGFELEPSFHLPPSPEAAWLVWLNTRWASLAQNTDEVHLTIVDGFLSFRDLDHGFEVGLYLVVQSGSDYPGTVVVSAPLADPW